MNVGYTQAKLRKFCKEKNDVKSFNSKLLLYTNETLEGKKIICVEFQLHLCLNLSLINRIKLLLHLYLLFSLSLFSYLGKWKMSSFSFFNFNFNFFLFHSSKEKKNQFILILPHLSNLIYFFPIKCTLE